MMIPFVGETYPSRSIVQNFQRTVNWYTVEDQHAGLSQLVLYPTPGLSVWLDLIGGVVRSLYVHKNILYAVVDATLYKITTSKVPTSLGTFTTSSGRISVASINNQIIWVDGTNGYHYNTDTTTYTQISDPQFPANCSWVAAQDGYFLAVKPNSDTFYVSDLLNGLTGWQALSFAAAERDSDNLVAIVSYNSQLYMLGELSTEIWYNSGQDVPPFKPVQNAYFPFGCASAHSVSTGDGSLFFVSKDRNGIGQIVRTAEGYQPVVIASRAVAYQTGQYTTISDSFSYMYQQDGHEFFVLTYPTEGKTWVYDLSNNAWHERESFNGSVYTRHRSNCYASFAGECLVGDYDSGKIFAYDNTAFKDDEQPIRRLRTSPPLFYENKMLSVYELELCFQPAIGNVGEDAEDPQVMLRISRDGGYTWGNILYGHPGKVGEYFKRILFPRLGRGRKFVFEVSVTDPNDFIFISAYGTVTPEFVIAQDQPGN